MKAWDFIKGRFGFDRKSNGDEKAFNRLVEAAVALLQSEDYSEARKALLRAAEFEDKLQDPQYMNWILGWLWITWEQTEEYDAATEFYLSFLARHPDDSTVYHLIAISHWYAGNLDEALKDYSRAIELDPNDVSAFSGRGQVRVESRQFAEAVEDLNSALGSLHSVPEADVWKRHLEAYARNGLGAAYSGLGQFDASAEQFEKSIELCPENAWVYFNRAEALRNRGERTNAVEDYLLALAKKEPKLTTSKRLHAKRMLDELAK